MSTALRSMYATALTAANVRAVRHPTSSGWRRGAIRSVPHGFDRGISR
jgi:hypothetical protein